jgi:opacity protein-like surface antigen
MKMKRMLCLAALAAALISLAPMGDALAGGRHDRDRHHHHYHDRGHDHRGGRHYHLYDRPPPPPPVHYYYYAPPPRPPATIIYRDYGRGPSLVLDVEIGRRR